MLSSLDVIVPLYEHGVSILCTEFSRREDQPLIDRLLAGKEYDESLAPGGRYLADDGAEMIATGTRLRVGSTTSPTEP